MQHKHLVTADSASASRLAHIRTATQCSYMTLTAVLLSQAWQQRSISKATAKIRSQLRSIFAHGNITQRLLSGQQVSLPALAEALEVEAGADTMGMTCVAALAGAAGAPAAANMGITAQHSTAQHSTAQHSIKA